MICHCILLISTQKQIWSDSNFGVTVFHVFANGIDRCNDTWISTSTDFGNRIRYVHL